MHNHAAYLVDALIDTSTFIKDWSTMVDILLSDYCKEHKEHYAKTALRMYSKVLLQIGGCKLL